MAEWLKVPAWKAGVPKGTVGSNPILSSSFFKIMDLRDSNKNLKIKIRRESTLGERAASTNFNPLEWSKWLYEIRQQLHRGTSRAEAYQDCEQHYTGLLNESSKKL